MLLSGPIRTTLPHGVSQHSIDPLSTGFVEHAVQLAHGDGFGVEHMGVDFVEAFCFQGGEGSFEGFVRSCLASSCRTHQHQTVPDLDGII